MKRPLLILTIAMLTWLGCSTATEKRYYQMHISPAATESEVRTLPGTALVRDARVDEVYSGFRLVYRYSPYQLDFYNYEYWIKKPSRMLRECIGSYLSSRQVFSRVIQERGRKDPDWVVDSQLFALEEFDSRDDWFAHLSMLIQIRRGPHGPVVAAHRFDRMDKLSRRDSRLLPRAVSEILKSEMEILVRDFRRRLAPADTTPAAP